MRRRSFLVVWAGLAWATVASAQSVLAGQSEIVFVSRQMGVPVEGRFRKFAADIRLDPRDPSGGRANLDIDLASVAIPGEETAQELARPGWFDSARVPIAKFQSTAIRSLGPDRYEVSGRLTLKGITQPLVFPVAVTRGSGDPVATGAFAIRRLAFKIGDGDWNDTSLVADEVQVRFRFTLSGLR